MLQLYLDLKIVGPSICRNPSAYIDGLHICQVSILQGFQSCGGVIAEARRLARESLEEERRDSHVAHLADVF